MVIHARVLPVTCISEWSSAPQDTPRLGSPLFYLLLITYGPSGDDLRYINQFPLRPRRPPSPASAIIGALLWIYARGSLNVHLYLIGRDIAVQAGGVRVPLKVVAVKLGWCPRLPDALPRPCPRLFSSLLMHLA